MRPLRYSINVSLDGRCNHDCPGFTIDEHTHSLAEQTIAGADAILLGRVTYQLMEDGWRWDGPPPAEMPEWMLPFQQTIDVSKKYVVSSTLDQVDWNSELLEGDLETAVRELKEQPGEGIYVGGVSLPQALIELDLIDEFEFVVHPVITGQGRVLFDGLSKPLELRLVDRRDLPGGQTAVKYEPVR